MATLWLLVLAGDGGDTGGLLLDLLSRRMREVDRELRIVVVHGGASDDLEALRRSSGRPVDVVRQRFPRHLSESLRDGLEWVAERCDDADTVVTLEAGVHDPNAVPALLEGLAEGVDVAVASRFRTHGAGAAAGACLRPLAPLSAVRDYIFGLRAYRAAAVRAAVSAYGGDLIEALGEGRTCQAEVLIKLARRGAVCREIPVPAGRTTLSGIGAEVDALLAARRAARLAPAERRRPSAGRLRSVIPATWEWYALAALMIAALVLRLWGIERIPGVLIHDEADNLVNVYQIINGRGPGVFGLDWKPQPAASVYLLSLSMRLGMSLTTLRLPAALFSVAALVPFFLLLRRVVAAPAALIATALLATDVWYLHFSRSGWENVETCLFLTGAALCAEEASRTGRTAAFAWAGFWSALGVYGYFSGRAVLPAVLLVFALSLLRPSISRWRLLGGALLTVLTALVLFAPQIPIVAEKWDVFQKRTRIVFAPGTATAAPGTATVLAHSLAEKTEQLFAAKIPIRGERTQRYLPVDSGALARPTVALLALGMVASLFWFSATWRWWIFFLVPFFLTEVLVVGRSLNGARGVIFVPVLYLFVGLGVHLVWTFCTRLWRRATVPLVAAAVVLAVFTTHRYFTWIRTPALLAALEPAIPVSQFYEWQRFQLDWTARSDQFYNLGMWKERAAAPPRGGHAAAPQRRRRGDSTLSR